MTPEVKKYYFVHSERTNEITPGDKQLLIDKTDKKIKSALETLKEIENNFNNLKPSESDIKAKALEIRDRFVKKHREYQASSWFAKFFNLGSSKLAEVEAVFTRINRLQPSMDKTSRDLAAAKEDVESLTGKRIISIEPRPATPGTEGAQPRQSSRLGENNEGNYVLKKLRERALMSDGIQETSAELETGVQTMLEKAKQARAQQEEKAKNWKWWNPKTW